MAGFLRRALALAAFLTVVPDLSHATPLHWIQPLSPIPKGEIFFAEGSAELSEDSKTVLAQVAEELLAHATSKVIVYGHADPFEAGSIKGAWDLGLKRALAAMYYLIGQGVPAERLRPDSRGCEYVILTHDTPEARAGMRIVTTEVQLPEPRSNQLCFGMCG